jgi:two-component system chemotaxis response regulator CheB
MRVLIVDDSVVFRSQISAALKGVPDVEVAGTAANGKIALQKLEQSSYDLVTLDMEMPEMDGLQTLREIRSKGFRVNVIVFSSQTVRGAEKAFEALQAGANDVVAKPSGEGLNLENASKFIAEALVPKVIQFLNHKPKSVNSSVKAPTLSQTPVSTKSTIEKRDLRKMLFRAVVIASSTGGPTALEAVFAQLTGPFTKPVFIAQHMGPVFTQILAKRLSEICGQPVHEAIHGQKVEAGHVYLAPGDFHLYVKKRDKDYYVHLDQSPLRNSVRPAADHLFESASEVYSENLLGVVLTGMGEDGAIGARKIREAHGGVVIQNKASCVVFGMPGTVFQNDDYDDMGDLTKIADILKSVLKS